MDYGWLSSYPNGVSNPAIAQDLTKVTASGAAALDPPKGNPIATSGRGGDGRGEGIEMDVMRRAVTGHITRKGATKAEERGSTWDLRRPHR